ncbi:MAG: MFS transporter [Candidatus Nanopelagicales bacterium]
MGTLPVFLLGAMGPFVRADLAFSESQLGIAVSMFWLFMAAGGIAGGRVGQRLGATLTTRLGVTGSMLAIVAMALAPNWPTLLVLMAASGLANALSQPAVDLALFEAVPRERLSLAFGIKQTALPGAALVAGLGIPVLASTIGWRWAFVVCAMVGLPALVGMPRLSPGHRRNPEAHAVTQQRLVGVYAFAAVFTLAMIAVSATGAFYVESAIARGSTANAAGVYLAIGSACGILGRFVFAWQLGKIGRPLVATAFIMIVGGVGVLSFAIVPPGWPLLLVTLIAIGAGWGWNGLLTLAVVSTYSEAPARASGYIVLGAGAGGVMGPILFGLAVQRVGFSPAWVAAGMCFFAAAALLLVLSRGRWQLGSHSA